MLRNFSLALMLACLVVGGLGAGVQPESDVGAPLRNGDFAMGEVGKAPEEWSVPTGGFVARTVTDATAANQRAAELRPSLSGGGGGAAFGNLMQAFDATGLRGRRVIVRADVRLVTEDGDMEALRTQRAQMWVRVDRPNQQQGFFDNMGDRPIKGMKSRNFETYSISGPVADDATQINVGVMSMGGATVRVSNVRVMSAPLDADADRPAAALSERGLANVVAFARLYGYVRFFHPSDQSAATEWEGLAICGVEHVEGAKDAEELAVALKDVFGPIAPTVQVWAGEESGGPAAPAKPEDAAKCVAWRHNGVELSDGPMKIYRSQRRTHGLDGPDAKLPEPGAAVVKSLGGGVWCRVPVCVYADESGRTLPRAMTEPLPLRPERPEWWSPSGKDRSVRLAGVVIAWNVFQHFYPYFDVVKTDWAAVLPAALTTAATDTTEREYERTLDRLVGALHDGHGNVYGTSISRARPAAMLLDWADASAAEKGEAPKLVVTQVAKGNSVMRVGDEIVAVQGKPVMECYREARPLISAATEQWARHRAAGDIALLMLGTKAGETIGLTIRRDGAEMNVEAPRLGENDAPLKAKRPAQGAEVAPGIVYFDLNAAETPALDEAMPKLQRAKGIVFDARGYPGSAGTAVLQHLTDKDLRSARWNVPIVTLPDLDPAGLTWNAAGRWNLTPIEPRLGADGQKVVFITGGGAISYAESCMAIVEHYKLGEIVGEATAGTNGNVNPFMLPGGYNILWTGMKVLKHDKSPHHGVGVLPTVKVDRTVAGIAAGRDEVLEAGVRCAGGRSR